MTAYYSEFDPKAAAWLRELIKQGHIADGVVDERDLWDVAPADLIGFNQVHLCAGIGVWSYALRRAGWPDSRPCWTASFPCQPFSAAGKGAGFADERHLWPAGFHLIRECQPDVIFGEQVSSKDGLMWFDLVSADLEGEGYAVGAADTCSACVGAPHIRQRLYWVADARHDELARRNSATADDNRRGETRILEGRQLASRGATDGLADDDDEGLEGRRQSERERAAERLAGAGGVAGGLADDAEPGRLTRRGQQQPGAGRDATRLEPGRLRDAGGLGHAEQLGAGRDTGTGYSAEGRDGRGAGSDDAGSSSAVRGLADSSEPRHDQAGQHGRGPSQLPARPAEHGGMVRPAGPTNGLWRDADWLLCRDGKWRPVEPGTFPLAHGAPARVGRLRGYGNAINAEAARIWIEAYLDTRSVDMVDRGLRVSVFD